MKAAELHEQRVARAAQHEAEVRATLEAENKVLASLPPDLDVASVFIYPLWGTTCDLGLEVPADRAQARPALERAWALLPPVPLVQAWGGGSTWVQAAQVRTPSATREEEIAPVYMEGSHCVSAGRGTTKLACKWITQLPPLDGEVGQLARVSAKFIGDVSSWVKVSYRISGYRRATGIPVLRDVTRSHSFVELLRSVSYAVPDGQLSNVLYLWPPGQPPQAVLERVVQDPA